MKSNKSIYCAIVSFFICGNAFAKGLSEISAGFDVGLMTPVYGEFAKTISAKAEPKPKTSLLLTGGHVTFAKGGFVTGGRVMFGSLQSESATTASNYNIQTLGFDFGYGWTMGGAVDLTVTNMLGIGSIAFSDVNAATSSVTEVSYLAIEPRALLGLAITNNFKVSIGYAYQLGFVHRVAQYGAQNYADPSKLSVGGTTMLMAVSFGQIGR